MILLCMDAKTFYLFWRRRGSWLSALTCGLSCTLRHHQPYIGRTPCNPSTLSNDNDNALQFPSLALLSQFFSCFYSTGVYTRMR